MDHMLVDDHLFYFDDFKDLAFSNPEFHLKIKKSFISHG